MNNIILITDFLWMEVLGGAEKNNDVLVKKLSKFFNIKIIKSEKVTNNVVLENINNFFIITNFILLNNETKNLIQNNCKYIIYEYDHKYTANNNPAVFEDFLVPDEYLINLDFYTNAKAVLCQSSFHAEILYKNTLLKNIISMGGNLWGEDDLNLLEKSISQEKTIEYAIYNTPNKNKGTQQAIEYCKENCIDFDFIEIQPYENFIKNLSKVKNFIFLPQWVDTYNRMTIEARILNCKIITNNLVGATYEPYFSLKGKDLLEYIKLNNDTIINKFISILKEEKQVFFQPFEIPKVSFITSLFKGRKYIENFLKNITNLDLFETAELLIYDSNSPENEIEIIQPYLNKYKNIIYKRLEKNYSPAEIHNMALVDSSGEYLTTAPVDDIRRKNYLIHMIRNLMFSEQNIVLIYGDCLQTEKENETFENNTARELYEHSILQFSKENMIKSLPGPMPVWKKNIHKQIGNYRTNIRYPIDWEMWLRMVQNGYEFKKINIPVGLYFFNPTGLTTSKENSKIKNKEEAKIFFEYKQIFGENFEKYKNYFGQFL
jgi:hypothetical protein